MEASEFKRWLRETMGLDAAAVGPGVVERAVAGRMRATGSVDLAAYWQRLRTMPLEQQELIEAVVVPETWFFRDTEAFEALARIYGARGAGVPLRLLSLPCSTGEEPYTMAMALLDAGCAPLQLRIDAIDISESALARAQRGVYGANSFRGRDLRYRERHFRDVGPGQWQVDDEVRSCVRFQHGNVLDIGFLPATATYDAVFCRNLLIYFDQETQVRTVGVLARVLKPDGVLFVGAAETGLLLTLNYVSAQMPMAFAFRKPRADAAGLPVPPALIEAQRQGASGHHHTARSVAKPVHSTGAPRRPLASPDAASQAPAESLLDAARRLADSGVFDKAANACQAYLRTHASSVEALHLLGLIHGAVGQHARAENCFRKALYLQPDHEESLMHLALLLETRGDVAAGRVLRQRALRHRSKAG